MNNETILDVPHIFYHTWHKSLVWFLERPGKEGELCTQIADTLSDYEYKTEAIATTFNCAYRNCIAIYRMRLPEYNYRCTVNEDQNSSEWGYSFTDQAITQILLSAQPEAKRSIGIQKVICKLERNIYSELFRYNNDDDLDWDMHKIKESVEEIDIDFTPCPDMIFVRSDIEAGKVNFTNLTNGYDHGRVKFLIDLMPAKEDKLYMLDRIDKAHKVWNPLPF